MPASLSYGNWSHVVVTYDGSNAKWYKDGAFMGMSAMTGNLVQRQSSLKMGNDAANSQPYKGALDDVRIYNRALTATEVQQLYAEMSTSQSTNIKANSCDADSVCEVAKTISTNKGSTSALWLTSDVKEVIVVGNLSVNALAGNGTAYACIDSYGKIFRSLIACR